MGPVRHRHLIRVLSLVVALNLVVGLGALYARSGNAGSREARVAAGASPAATGDGVLAAGQFSQRRGQGTVATTSTRRPTDAPPAAGSAPGTSGPGPGPGPGPAAGTATPTSTGPPTTPSSAPGGPSSGGSTTGSPSPAPTTAPTSVTTATTAHPSPAGTAAAGDPAGTLIDPAGDTFVDGTEDPITESRADIVRAGAAYGPGGLTFTLQVGQSADPRRDGSWGGDSTYAVWAVDTNADGGPDYEVQYYFDATDGGLHGSVSRPGDDAAAPSLCDASDAAYGPDGYSVTIDPACLGNPASFAYRATIYYDTDPKDDNADVASDVAPDGGLSFPVTRPAP